MSGATLVYDDGCGFCTWWADLFVERADLRVVGFSELPPDLRDQLPDDYEECSHLVTDGAVHSCGASVEAVLVHTFEDLDPLVDLLCNFEDYERLRERAYRWAADRRDVWGQFLSKAPPAGRRSDG